MSEYYKPIVKILMLKGKDGDGKGISSISKTGTSGLVDTYTIMLTDGTKSTFTVTNGAKGDKGDAGPQGQQGDKGDAGPQGQQGVKGQDGQSIKEIKKTSTSGLTDTYEISLTDGTKKSFTVSNGKGIKSIVKTSTSGLVDTYTITYTDSTTSTFTVKNGESVKEWVTLVDDSKTVENLSTIEFDLANAELHDEFRLYVEVGKNANADEKQHNLNININGMAVGYYLFNTKWDANYIKYFEFEKLPKPRILTSTTSSVNVSFNAQNVLVMYNNLGAETGNGKILFNFPTNYKYTGTIKVQLYAR
jgi:hypothetical protein